MAGLLVAIVYGTVAEVQQALSERNPDHDDQLLSFACRFTSADVVEVVLQDPHSRARLNYGTELYGSPLKMALWERPDNNTILQVLLTCPDLNLNAAANRGPLRDHFGLSPHYEWVMQRFRMIVASPAGANLQPLELETTPPEIERYEADSVRVRHEYRVLLHPATVAAEIFALIVLATDGFLRMIYTDRIDNKPQSTSKRFFRVATSLPMELQMILAHRTARSPRQNITSKQLGAVLVDMLQ
jgi:hypothetical protein